MALGQEVSRECKAQKAIVPWHNSHGVWTVSSVPSAGTRLVAGLLRSAGRVFPASLQTARGQEPKSPTKPLQGAFTAGILALLFGVIDVFNLFSWSVQLQTKVKSFRKAVRTFSKQVLTKRSNRLGKDPDAAPRHASSEEEDSEDGEAVPSSLSPIAIPSPALASSFKTAGQPSQGSGEDEVDGAGSDADLVVQETDGAGNDLHDDAVWRLLHNHLGSMVSADASPPGSSRSLPRFASVASVISSAGSRRAVTSGVAIGGTNGATPVGVGIRAGGQVAGSSSREKGRDRVPQGVRSVSFQLPDADGNGSLVVGASSPSVSEDNLGVDRELPDGSTMSPLSPRSPPRSPRKVHGNFVRNSPSGSSRRAAAKQQGSPRLATIPASPVPDHDLPTGCKRRVTLYCRRACGCLCRHRRVGVGHGNEGSRPEEPRSGVRRPPTHWFCRCCYRETCCNRRPAAVDDDLGVPREPMDELCCCTPRMSPYLRHRWNLCKRSGRLCRASGARRCRQAGDTVWLAGVWFVEWVLAPFRAREDEEAGDWGADTRHGPDPRFVDGSVRPKHYTTAHVGMVRDGLQLIALLAGGLQLPHAFKVSVGTIASAVAFDLPTLLPGALRTLACEGNVPH